MPKQWAEAVDKAATPAREDARYGVRMRSYFMAAGTSLLAMGLVAVWHLAGMIGLWQLLLVEALVAGCLVGFYIAIRTGWNRRFADPSLTVPQMAAASCSMLVGAFVADSGRALFLVLVMMVLMFGVLRLRTRALLIYTGFNLAGYAGVIGLLWWFRPAALDLRLELLQLLVLAATMPWFALMGGYITGLRERIKSALRTVESSERSLAEAQRMARFGSWSFDSATQTAYWSVETYRIFGLDARDDALSGAEFRSLVHPDDRQRYAQLIEQAVRDGGELKAEYRIVLPSGAVRWVHALARPVPKEGVQTTLLRGTVMDITERKEAEDQIRQLAHFDALTGLPNRNLLMQLLRQAIADTERHDTPLAIFFIDLDGFKKVNDTLGHDAGDLLLAGFAQRLGHSLRRSDIAARLGGDEFVVLIKDFGCTQDLEALADRLLAAAAAPFQVEGEQCSVSASIGIATYPDAGTDVDALIKSADGAMYQAKHEGRNRFALLATTP